LFVVLFVITGAAVTLGNLAAGSLHGVRGRAVCGKVLGLVLFSGVRDCRRARLSCSGLH
jgi:hypothetical protein